MIRICKMKEFISEETKMLEQAEKDFTVFFFLILKGIEEEFTFTK